jgi:predicted nucleic acid-binding protein
VTLVLDASVAIKLYVAEPDSDRAEAAVALQSALAVPELILVEVGQALLRHSREGRFDLTTVKTALADLAGMTHQPIATADLLPRALDLAARMVHGLHDCLYLALAERLSCPLLTADAKLAGKVERADLPISIELLTNRSL